MPSIAICVCAIAYAALACVWSQLPSVLGANDTLFDADANRYLQWFTKGGEYTWVEGSHALLRYYFSGWYGLLLELIIALGLDGSLGHIRLVFPFLIPIACGVLTLHFFRDSLARLGVPAIDQVALLLLAGFSFSSVIFFSLPEQFSLSALATCYALRGIVATEHGQITPFHIRFSLAVLATGVVATNIVMFALWEFSQYRVMDQRNVVDALRRTLFWTVCVLLAVFTVATVAVGTSRLAAGDGLSKMFSTGAKSKFIGKSAPEDFPIRYSRLLFDAFALGRVTFRRQRDLPFAAERPQNTLNYPVALVDWKSSPGEFAALIWGGF